MNFLSKLLLPKVAGTVGAFMLAIIMALSVSVYTKSQRIESLSTSLASVRSEMGLWQEATKGYKIAADLKDDVIRRQTGSIKSLKEKSDAERAAYHQRLQASMAVASTLRQSAEDILKLDAGTTDELGLCRAARELLEKELTDA